MVKLRLLISLSAAASALLALFHSRVGNDDVELVRNVFIGLTVALCFVWGYRRDPDRELPQNSAPDERTTSLVKEIGHPEVSVLVAPGSGPYAITGSRVILPESPFVDKHLWAALAHELGHAKGRTLHNVHTLRSGVMGVAAFFSFQMHPDPLIVALILSVAFCLQVGLTWASEIVADIYSIKISKRLKKVTAREIIGHWEVHGGKACLTHPPSSLRAWVLTKYKGLTASRKLAPSMLASKVHGNLSQTKEKHHG